jgi:predicted PolB exonuclease-like 3'-5' exonuclease
MICIFDCETIPDAALLRKTHGYEGDDASVAAKAVEDQEAKTGSGFLPIAFHQVVAISAVIADDFGAFRRVSSMEGENEEALIRAFLQFIDRHNPKLVSFNGRSFDMPMLMVRALAYNLTCPAYFDTDNRELNKSKWEHYRARFSDRFHVDLMDHMSDFGAARGLKLDHVCAHAGLPGKYDVSGDQVMTLYFASEIEKIKTYCESDVLNTYWLYLKYELLKGNLTCKDYANALQLMAEGLLPDKSYSPVFLSHIEKEHVKLSQNIK